MIAATVDVVHKLARAIRRHYGYGDVEELIADGYLALCRAAADFKPDHPGQASFRTFAGHRIKGAIIDSLRQYRRGIGVIRSGGVMKRKLTFTSLDYQTRDGRTRHYEVEDPAPGPFEQLAEKERAAFVLTLPLNPRERRIALSRLKGQTQGAVAAAEGVSAMRIYQLERGIVAKGRRRLCGVDVPSAPAPMPLPRPLFPTEDARAVRRLIENWIDDLDDEIRERKVLRRTLASALRN